MIGIDAIATDRMAGFVAGHLRIGGVQETAAAQLGREVSAEEFTVVLSYVKEFPTTAGPRRGGVAGQAFTIYRITVLVSAVAIFAFYGERLFGFAPYSDSLNDQVAEGILDGLGQVDVTTGEYLFPPAT